MRGLRVPRWVMLSPSSCVDIFTYCMLCTGKAATAQTLSPARNVAVARSLLRLERNGLLGRPVRSTV